MKASLDFAAATEADSSASSAVYAVGDHVVVLKFALATVGVVAEVRDGVYGVRCARRSMIVCEFMCVRVCMCVCVCASVCVCCGVGAKFSRSFTRPRRLDGRPYKGKSSEMFSASELRRAADGVGRKRIRLGVDRLQK